MLLVDLPRLGAEPPDHAAVEPLGVGRHARGHLVHELVPFRLSSIGGRVALPLVGAYNASKFALEGASDALRRELLPRR